MPRSYHILVTLGPTWEFIDPIRFITNRATGTFGYSIAKEGLRRGHRVTCIAGPTAFRPLRGSRWISVVTAEEMRRKVLSVFPKSDILIMNAAVSDYRLARPFSSKLKRTRGHLTLSLIPNKDILKDIGRMRKKQFLVGFALETEALLPRALSKLKQKKLDLIIANQAGGTTRPFGDRKITTYFIWKGGRRKVFRNFSKERLAGKILDAVEVMAR